jgi:hypothetical protein
MRLKLAASLALRQRAQDRARHCPRRLSPLRRLANRVALANVTLVLLGFSGFAAPTLAQTSSADWQFVAVLYGYFPQITGSATFATGTSADITIDPNQHLSSLNFGAMGAFEARKGPWGVFTDLLYMNASGSKAATRALSISGVTIPGAVTAL